jgi:repressor LexA
MVGSPAKEAAMHDDLTPRQQRILEYISATVRERGYPPTVREIGEAVGLTSSSSVHSQLSNLQRKGLLHKDPTKPRALLVDEPRPNGVAVPVLGPIAAGPPSLAADRVEDYLTVPTGFVDGVDHFALRVRGDSMIDAGILDGDMVVVRRQDSADTGDIVAVLLPGPAEEEATVKRLRLEGDRVVLVPENPALEPFDMTEGAILGKVVAVLRKL